MNAIGRVASPPPPTISPIVDAGGRAIVHPSGPSALTRGANWLSQAAPRANVIALLASMVTKPGDRPRGETPVTTAARQERMAREYKALVNAKRPGAITGDTVDEILASIQRYRGSR